MSQYTVKWGIISTGGIATKFAQDLLVDPSTRDASDILHKVTAIGSRSTESAQNFLDNLKNADKAEPCAWGAANGSLEGCKPYGSYEEVYSDPNVDAVYIGTPHTYHHRNTKDALLAGKHVLCEKPFTFNMEELDELIKIAKEKNLFLMEAVWTRFHPIAYAVQDVIHSGKLGKVKRFSAEFSGDFKPDTQPDSHRMIDPKLGGGSLLDMGPYPSVWAMLVLHMHPDNKGRKAPKMLSSHQTVYQRSKVDANSRWLLEWEGLSQALLTTDMTCAALANNTCAVQCEEGDLVIENPPYKPTTFHILPHTNPGKITEASKHDYPVHPGGGMHYEADEVARCLRDGKKESERMPLDESRIVQGWFDDVRKAGNTVLRDQKGTEGQ